MQSCLRDLRLYGVSDSAMFTSATPHNACIHIWRTLTIWSSEATAWEQDMPTGMRVCDPHWSVYSPAHAHMSISQASIVTSMDLCTQYMSACVYVTC